MSIRTEYYVKNTDIGEYFVDLCNNQTIYGIKTFNSVPEITGLVISTYISYNNSEKLDFVIPANAYYCNIEICSGGGGGGGGGYNNYYQYGGTDEYIGGGFGGAGGTYYKIKLYIKSFNRYSLKCGKGGKGGRGGIFFSDYNDGEKGSDGNSSYINFYNTDNPDTSYNLLVNGGGGGMGGKYDIRLQNLNVGGVNNVYNNNGSYYTYTDTGNVFTPYIIDSVFNQPSGGGYGSSSVYNSNDYYNASKGGLIYFNNKNSNVLYPSCGLGVSASSSNPFNGGGGGNFSTGAGNGLYGGGGGGGVGYAGTGGKNNGNGGNGGDGFIKLYFY
jgi:hypothetical protein